MVVGAVGGAVRRGLELWRETSKMAGSKLGECGDEKEPRQATKAGRNRNYTWHKTLGHLLSYKYQVKPHLYIDRKCCTFPALTQ